MKGFDMSENPRLLLPSGGSSENSALAVIEKPEAISTTETQQTNRPSQREVNFQAWAKALEAHANIHVRQELKRQQSMPRRTICLPAATAT